MEGEGAEIDVVVVCCLAVVGCCLFSLFVYIEDAVSYIRCIFMKGIGTIDNVLVLSYINAVLYCVLCQMHAGPT